ncbi:MAG: hypothetical protein V3U03_14330, partial [Myxococcota bacterium]
SHLIRLATWLSRDEDSLFFRANLDSAFAIHPGQDVDTPWYRRTAIGRLLRTLAGGGDQARQDRYGYMVVALRMHRKHASALMPLLPELSPALKDYARNIDAIIDAAQARGVRPIFLTQPTLWRPGLSEEARELLWMGAARASPRATKRGQPYYTVEALAEGMRIYNDELLRICRERGVECIDAAATLPQDTSVFWDDAHMTEEGARQLAELVAAYLLDTPPLAELRPATIGSRAADRAR